MRTKNLLFAAIAVVAMASCTSNDFTGDPSTKENGNGVISFNSGTPAITRADRTGSAAATDLNNHFYVYGIKKESVDGAGNVLAGNLVFNNYAVNWSANTAMTTTSNTENWEYVGYTLTEKERAKITVNSGNVAQTIKYWDWGAADYTFYAFSAKPEDISGDKITVAKVQNQTSAVYDNGYTVTLAADASLDDLFFSERAFIENSNNTNRQADNTYGGNVTFRFHNMASKVRVAMYETIPGYKVTLNSFKVVNSADPTFATMTTAETGAFKANFVNNASGTAGSMTVKYIASGATQNHPTVAFTPTATAANILTLGDQLKAGVDLGTSVTEATYDKSAKAYTSVFPKEDNTQNLKLKVCYTLTAVDNSGNATTGETITVTDATAEVPANYLKWKPGYAYTYIFKISPNTNGQTGTGTTPAGLYPITFDAVETVNEDGLAEYITTVSEPSITTFGVKVNSSDEFQAYVTGGSDYQKPTGTDKLDIYATIVDDGAVITPTEGTNVNYYSIAYKDGATAAEMAGTPITEGSVAEVIAENPASPLIVCTKNNALGEPVTTVPGEDGVNITGTHAVKFANLAAGIYAIEYITTQTYYTSGSTYASSELFTAAGTLYKDANGTEEADASYYSSHTGDTYYKREGIKKHAKTYKVITVTAAP
jgi:hypothetical protein